MFKYTPKSDLLAGRTILVTGAGDGIGAAAARTYAKHGATVVLLGRTLEKLETVYDQIEADGGAQPAIVPINLETAGEHDYIELSNQLFDTFGSLDGLLHNAGLLGVITPLEGYDPVIWQQVMQVNVHSQMMLTQAMLPLLKRSEDASIIFTSSSVGRKGRAHWGAYAVSKFATEGMSQVLADELENISSVRVNCINPGATRTKMRSYAYPGEDPTTNPTPEEIMPLYLFLAGADSKGITGRSFDAQGNGDANDLLTQ